MFPNFDLIFNDIFEFCKGSEDSAEEKSVSGPQLFGRLDALTNLKELNLSITANHTMAHIMDDRSSKDFFSTIQQRLGDRLEKLNMTNCFMSWQRPAGTAASLLTSLRKCERLVSIGLVNLQLVTEHDDPVHWLLDAVITACPHLEELNLSGTKLTALQSYNLGINTWFNNLIY